MEIKIAVSHCIDDLGLAKTTRATYSFGLNCFAQYLAEQGIDSNSPVETITMDHFVYFFPWLNQRFSKLTTGVYGAASKAFMDWLVIGKYIEPSYYDTLRYKKSAERAHKRHEDRLPRSPQKDDVARMQNAVRLRAQESPRKERDIALIEFLATTGCRVSEAVSLNIKDIDLLTRSVVVLGKGSKERRVFFSQVAEDALIAYWTERKSSLPADPIFGRHDKGAGSKIIKRITTTTARTIVHDVAGEAGIDPSKFTPHYFRHAFATHVLSETHDLALVQDLLGHSDPKSTRVYAKIQSEDLQKAHREIFN